MASQGHGEMADVPGSRRVNIAPPNINVTPLIDVLLVLIIIFMVIQPRREAKFETNIPEKPENNDDKTPPPTDILVVTIGLSGTGLTQTVKLNQTEMTLQDLGTTLKDVLARRPPEARTVFVKGPKDKQYGDVVSVVDTIKGAGATKIGLQVDYLE
jgi:biopolymer transport protein ExbD